MIGHLKDQTQTFLPHIRSMRLLSINRSGRWDAVQQLQPILRFPRDLPPLRAAHYRWSRVPNKRNSLISISFIATILYYFLQPFTASYKGMHWNKWTCNIIQTCRETEILSPSVLPSKVHNKISVPFNHPLKTTVFGPWKVGAMKPFGPWILKLWIIRDHRGAVI